MAIRPWSVYMVTKAAGVSQPVAVDVVFVLEELDVTDGCSSLSGPMLVVVLVVVIVALAVESDSLGGIGFRSILPTTLSVLASKHWSPA